MNTCALFHLPLVACPHELIPLHIFEDRYKEMIADCLARQQAGDPAEFAICLFDEERPRRVGVVVKFVRVLKHYPDGRLDILTQGCRRVAIREVPSAKSYRLTSTGRYDDTRSDWSEQLATEAFNLHRALIQMITGAPPGDAAYGGVAQLSFLLASTLHLDPDVKQQLIELRDEDARLTLLVEHMTILMHQLESVQLAARTIQGSWELQQRFAHGNDPA